MSLSSLHLDAFLETARARSFSKAADRLGLTQSALSQRILNLESELGAPLILREPSGLRMTALGEELLRYCQAREQLETEFLGRMKAGPKSPLAGSVRIAGFSSITRSVILPALRDLVTNNPAIHIEILSRELNDLPGLLRSGEADFVVLAEELRRAGVKCVKLGEEVNVLCEAKDGTSRPDTFLDHDVNDQTTETYFRLQGRRPERFERSFLDDVYGILDAVELGFGRAVLPRHLLRGRKGIRIARAQEPLRVPLILHYFEQPFYPQLFEKTIEALTKQAPRFLEG